MPDTTPSAGPSVLKALISSGLASYFMTQCSLHGVNFETLGVSSEIVKSTLIAGFVSFFTWLTFANLIIYAKSTHDNFSNLWSAITGKKGEP